MFEDSTLPATLVSIIVTWVIAAIYFRKSSKDLKEEASELRHLNTLMLLGMEHVGWVTLDRGSSGEIRGFRQTIQASGIPGDEIVPAPSVMTSPPPDSTS